LCPVGQTADISNGGTGTCRLCAAGTYEVNNICQPCPTGQGSPAGATVCKACEGATVALNGDCSPCPASSYTLDHQTCIPCLESEGKYIDNNTCIKSLLDRMLMAIGLSVLLLTYYFMFSKIADQKVQIMGMVFIVLAILCPFLVVFIDQAGQYVSFIVLIITAILGIVKLILTKGEVGKVDCHIKTEDDCLALFDGADKQDISFAPCEKKSMTSAICECTKETCRCKNNKLTIKQSDSGNFICETAKDCECNNDPKIKAKVYCLDTTENCQCPSDKCGCKDGGFGKFTKSSPTDPGPICKKCECLLFDPKAKFECKDDHSVCTCTDKDCKCTNTNTVLTGGTCS